jgi:hypothetical protein
VLDDQPLTAYSNDPARWMHFVERDNVEYERKGKPLRGQMSRNTPRCQRLDHRLSECQTCRRCRGTNNASTRYVEMIIPVDNVDAS